MFVAQFGDWVPTLQKVMSLFQDIRPDGQLFRASATMGVSSIPHVCLA